MKLEKDGIVYTAYNPLTVSVFLRAGYVQILESETLEEDFNRKPAKKSKNGSIEQSKEGDDNADDSVGESENKA